MRTPVLFCALICFGSFGWGMVCHFRRMGKPSHEMTVTGLLGILFCGLNLWGIAHDAMWLPAVSAGLYMASAALFWWAVRFTRQKLAACGQGMVTKELVTAGPYRWIRHPFYAAYNLTWIAGFVATGWWPLGVAALAMIGLYEYFARQEERGFLQSGLSAAYERYRSRTGKYWPGPHLSPPF